MPSEKLALRSWMQAEARHGSCSQLTLSYFRNLTYQLTSIVNSNKYLQTSVTGLQNLKVIDIC